MPSQQFQIAKMTCELLTESEKAMLLDMLANQVTTPKTTPKISAKKREKMELEEMKRAVLMKNNKKFENA